MNAIDNVRRAFRSKYSFDVQSTWLQPCLAWLQDQFQLADFTNNYTLEKIYAQWLHTDIALIPDASSLPNDLDLNAKKVQLSGKYALQVNSISCISEPYYAQVLDIHGERNENERIDTDITETQTWKPPPAKRVLYLELTDGKIILRGLEYETISSLDRDATLPGAKILVTGPAVFRRGMLLLTSKNTQVLGGYVESLIDKNSSVEIALASLSKTAAKLNESRERFNRLNIKVHATMNSDNSMATVSNTRTNQNNFPEDEDEVDEFIRQAYADGVLDDDNHTVPDPIDYYPPPPPLPPPPPASSSRNTQQSLNTKTTTNNRTSMEIDQPQDLILISDDDDTRLSAMNVLPTLSPSHQTSHLSTSASPVSSLAPTLVIRPSIPNISLPYTYLSLIRHEMSSSTRNNHEFIIKGCFSSLVTNPRVVKNEFDLEALVNDGSDCLLVRIAPNILDQRLGMTAVELMAKRKACKDDADKRKLQMDFNERLKKFGQSMSQLYTLMTIKFSSENEKPVVIKIIET